MRNSVFTGVGIVALAFCTTTGASAADSPWLYGIHWYGATDSTDVESMSGGKGIYVLEQVLTDTASEGNVWDSPESKVEPWSLITSRGHTIIARIHPNWGRAVPARNGDYSIDQFAADCEKAARTLSDVCHIWQLGNEPNLLLEYQDSELPPDWYTHCYKAVRDAIHRVKSPLGPQIVLLGPVSPGPVIPDVRWMHGSDYLRAMLDGLDPETIDGIALHNYAWQGEMPQILHDFARDLVEQISIVDNAGCTRQPIYITEWNRASENTNEVPTSAVFLHSAYRWLNRWNRTPGNHNIVTACWFVYPEDSGWNQYSILAHKLPDGTPDTDLWHAFQYAASQDYPAGCRGIREPVRHGWKMY